MASLPGSRTAGFIASPPAVSKPCGLPFASVVSTFPAPSGKPRLHETSALMSIPGEELHNVPCRANGQCFLNPLPLCQHDLAAVAPDTHVHLYQFIKIGLRVGAELSKQGETCWKRPMPRRPRKVPPISGATVRN